MHDKSERHSDFKKVKFLRRLASALASTFLYTVDEMYITSMAKNGISMIGFNDRRRRLSYLSSIGIFFAHIVSLLKSSSGMSYMYAPSLDKIVLTYCS
jgi:hypothetical protein